MNHRRTTRSRILLFSVILVLLTWSITPALAQIYTESDEAQQRLNWYEQHQEMRAASPFNNIPWQFVGPQSMTGRLTDVAAHPAQPDTIYVASASGGVFKSTDDGETWMPIFEDYPAASIGDLALAPSNPNIVWIGTGEANILRSSMAGTGVYKSTNGGRTFRYMGLADTHHIARIVIHPENPDHILVGNDGGLMISHDGLQSYEAPDNIPIAQMYNVSVSQEKGTFWAYTCIQDNMGWRGQIDLTGGRNNITRQDWQSGYGDESGRHAVDPSNPNIVYTVSRYGGGPSRYDLTEQPGAEQTGRRRNSQSIAPDFEGVRKRAQWVSPIIVSPHDNKRILYGAQFVFLSDDQGNNWRRISPDLTNYDPAKQGNIAYSTVFAIDESPVKKGLIYAGTDDGNVQVTRDEGQTWTNVSAGLPPEHCIASIDASAFDEATVYAAVNGKRNDDFNCYIFKSTDYGQTWTNIAHNIPGSIANVVKEDPTNKNILYVGTDRAVYVTIDGGAAWNVLGKDLPSIYVQDLDINQLEQVAVIATHGRGAFVIDLLPVRKAAK